MLTNCVNFVLTCVHLTTKGLPASCANLLRELLWHLVFANLSHLVFAYTVYLVCEQIVFVLQSLER